MQRSVRTFRVPKVGEKIEFCQDSVRPRETEPEANPLVVVVSDGTTTSFFSHVWSDVLVTRFVADVDGVFGNWGAWLSEARADWQATLKAHAESKAADFFTKNDYRLRKPAAATLAGVQFAEAQNGEVPWRGLVLGDSCIIHLSGKDSGVALHSYALEKSSEFSALVQAAESYPPTAKRDGEATPIAAVPSRYNSAEPFATRAAHPIREGDVFLLVTDALGKWLLRRSEDHKPVWGELLELRTPAEFIRLVDAARAEKTERMENDDVTLAVITFGTPHAAFRKCLFMAEADDAPAAPEKPRGLPIIAQPPVGEVMEPLSISPPAPAPVAGALEPKAEPRPPENGPPPIPWHGGIQMWFFGGWASAAVFFLMALFQSFRVNSANEREQAAEERLKQIQAAGKPADAAASPENKPPTPENKPPTPENKPPTPENKPPTPENKPALPENKPASPENKPPTPENKPPTPENKPPAPENKQPTLESKPPPPESKPPTPESKPPTPDKKPIIGGTP